MSQTKEKEKLKFMASQLRKPFGEKASMVGEKMDKANAALFDLTLESMDLQEGDKILEIGFGTGSYIRKIFDQTEELEFHGVDYSEEMVDKASKENDHYLEAGKLNLELGNSNDMPFDDENFDKIFCNMLVYFWEDPANHLEEVKRVLQPDGKFYTGIRTKESMRQLPFIDYGFNLYGKEEWKNVLENNGFQVTDMVEQSDPPIEVGEQNLHFESVCIIAEKD